MEPGSKGALGVHRHITPGLMLLSSCSSVSKMPAFRSCSLETFHSTSLYATFSTRSCPHLMRTHTSHHDVLPMPALPVNRKPFELLLAT